MTPAQELRKDVNEPDLRVVPIRMDLMSPNDAAVMILCCRKARIAYTMYDEFGKRIHVPPPEVARLLGEEDD